MGANYTIQADYEILVSGDNLEVLKKAASELFAASEQDFERMKSQTWYKRTWQLITFSRNNEKAMAKNITSLAKAQDIVLKLLLMLSDENKEAAAILSGLSSEVYALTRTTEQMAYKVVELDNFVKYGYKKSGAIDEFSDAQKSVLLAALNYIADQYNHREELAVFLTRVRKMAKVNERNSEFNIATFVFDDKQSRVIFPMLIEMNYICTNGFDLCDEVCEMIDHLSISSSYKKQRKEQIEADINRIGLQGIIELYHASASEYEYGIDDSDIEFSEWFEFAEEADSEVFQSLELTEVTISNILHVAEDEVKSFMNHVIHIHSYIDCAGELTFENCEIYYHESPETPCQIVLKTGSTFSINNCKVVRRTVINQPFIKDIGAVSLSITNSLFEDCGFFLQQDSQENSRFLMQGCEMINPEISFVKLDSKGEANICNCRISFNRPYAASPLTYDNAVFYCSQWSNDLRITVNEVVVQGNSLSNVREKDEPYSRDITLFSMDNAKYTNCTFNHINRCISSASKVSHCKFEDCRKVIDIGLFIKDSKIGHNTFRGCESVISGSNMTIIHCQFVECSNSLIESSYGSNVKVEYCEFFNIKYSEEVPSYSTKASLLFYKSKREGDAHSSVKKCVFNGFELNNSFLIAGQVYEKINGRVVYVEECSFKNCTTKRDSGKIIKCYDTYSNLFKKRVEVEVTSISNCLGLDKVNMENGYAEDVVLKSKDNSGAVIGAAVAGFVVGGLFGAINLASSVMIKNALTNDTDMHIE